MNLGDASLRFVNTSRPQLIHTTSKQSVTVSDDYYSIPSDDSSSDDRTAILRYQTPPSQMRSAHASRDALQSEATIPPLRPVTREQRILDSKPSVEEGLPARRRTNSETSPPTPGIDDTPFVRFALDQLTRDEELLGRRRQGAASEDSYPAGNVILDQGESYRSTKHERQNSNLNIKRPQSQPTRNVLMPVEPDEDSLQFPRLDFVPRPLRLLFIAPVVLCCLLMMVALVFCNTWSMHHHGLLQYDGVGTKRYFLFQYLPQLLATLIIISLFTIVSAVQRVLPFSILATEQNDRSPRALHALALFQTSFLTPNLSLFKNGERVLGFCYIIFWISLFTIPLQSSFFQTRYYILEGQDVWRWTAVEPVGWTLLVLYVLLAVGLMLIWLRFSRRATGLRWDPASLADILVLLNRSNISSDFSGSKLRATSQTSRATKSYRLGYWSTSSRPNEAFHSFGEANAPGHANSGKAETTQGVEDSEKFDLEGQRPMVPDSSTMDVRSPAVRYRWIPWFLRDTFVVAWIVSAVVLTIAFVVVSFVNHAVENGFLPLLPAPTTTSGFSPANFLYSFLPSLLGMALSLAWQSIDVYFRALQPFASLSNRHGTTAEDSLLLDYTASFPFAVTVKAALAGHYKVAWISFIGILSFLIPVLSGGIFTAQFFEATQDVRIAASMPGYEALVVFVIIYTLSLFIIWPTRKRYLPHDIRTLGQLLSFLYQSPLVGDKNFREPQSKVDLVTRLLGDQKYVFQIYVGNDGIEHLGVNYSDRPSQERR